MINFLHTHPYVLTCIMMIMGFCIGSFLNVVIYRLPIMLEIQWQIQYSAHLDLSQTPAQTATQKAESLINLIQPASHCPYCKQPIPFYLNLPILGYFLAGRKCQQCTHPISPVYLSVELLSGLLSGFITSQLGLSFTTLGMLVFTWLLIPLIWIDIKHQLLPDHLTQLGIWLGLFFNWLNVSLHIPVLQTDAPPHFLAVAKNCFEKSLSVSLQDAVIGAIAGYISLWLIAYLFRWIRKKEGIGYGDFKLFSMIGAWQGWQALPLILFFASLSGLCVSLIRYLLKQQKLNAPIAFGPYLAINAWIVLFLPWILTCHLK